MSWDNEKLQERDRLIGSGYPSMEEFRKAFESGTRAKQVEPVELYQNRKARRDAKYKRNKERY